MNKFIPYLWLSIALIGSLFAKTARCQSAATATWALTANQNAVTTGSITATAGSLTGINHFDYITGGERLIPPGNAWPAETAPNSGRYLQYTVSPASGKNLSVTEIKVSLSFNGSSACRAGLSYSTDGANFTDITTYLFLRSSSTPDDYSFTDLNIPVLNGQTLYFRVSPFTTAAISSKYMIIKNVIINADTIVTNNATWALTANQNAVTTGYMAAVPQSLTGLIINNYISGSGGQRILPSDTTWPAETGPNSNRYALYVTEPAAGRDLTVKQIGLALSFNSSSFGHANIAWSTDNINYTDLITNLSLASGSVPKDTILGGLNISVPNGKKLYIKVSPWTTGLITDTKFLVSKNIRLEGTIQASRQIAFPGAEGGGRFTKGGRGARVYYVTNLNDAGAGSLRDAVSQPYRTVLFKVSGTIFLSSTIILDKSNITIAGQTAPGDGICLAGHGMYIKANDIIIRYIRSRPGDTARIDVDALSNYFGAPFPYSNIIIDHCSLSWSTDEVGSFYAVSNFTLQWSMLSESLYYSFHHKSTGGDKTPHGYGGIWGGQNATFHHNLLASNSNRNPRFSGSDNTGRPDLEYVDYRNNVVYNWDGSSYAGTGGHQNMVNNYYKPGPATTGSASCVSGNRRHRILTYNIYTLSQRVPGDTIWGGKFHIKGNYVYGYPCASDTNDISDNNWTNGVYPGEASYPGAFDSIAAARQNLPFPYSPVTTQTAKDAYLSVMDSSGAILPRRDTLDRRIIRETRTGTATYEDTSYNKAGVTHPSGFIDSQNTVGGWPTLTSTTYPNDTDNDGLPDWWEAKTSGNDADTTSINGNSFAGDGYTMLEKYLNAIQSPDQQAVFAQATGTIIGKDSVRINFTIDWAKDLFAFGLYRSTDNVSFTKIGQVASNINKTKYILNDFAAPHQQLYYKIGSVRLDGKGDTVYSTTINIDNSSMGMMVNPSARNMAVSTMTENTITGLKVFPNPVFSSMVVEHPKASAGATISVYTSSGQMIKTYRLKAGNTRTTLEVGPFAKGAYLLMMDNITTKESIVFVKQ